MQETTQTVTGKAVLVNYTLGTDEYIIIITATKGGTVKTAKIDFM